MGDSETDAQNTKKRAAGVQLTRDNPGLDDDEESPEQESGTFKRASDEVLATRRIVKVRRQQTSSGASNPFSAIRLVPAAPQVIPLEESANGGNKEIEGDSQVELPKVVSAPSTEKTEILENNEKLSETAEGILENKEIEESSLVESPNVVSAPVTEKAEINENSDKLSETTEGLDPENNGAIDANKVEDGQSTDADLIKDETQIPTEGNGDDGKGRDASAIEKSEENTNFSFGNLSSRQNAFSGLSGTGFSATSFTFGTISKDGASASFGFGSSSNGDSSLFDTMSNAPSMSEATKVTPLQEVQVETGEEKEKTIFTADSALYEFIEGSWKERGKGELKINLGTEGKPKARLVMRTKGNLRLILNASLFPDMKLTSMDKRGISFACVNSANETKDGLTTYALKFKNASVVESFEAEVTKYKSETSTAPKTPENSPKEAAE